MRTISRKSHVHLGHLHQFEKSSAPQGAKYDFDRCLVAPVAQMKTQKQCYVVTGDHVAKNSIRWCNNNKWIIK